MAEQVRFRYVDSNGDDQIIASNVGDGAQIDNVKQTRRFRDTHKIMVWGDIELFNAFPQDKTKFQASEPEIFFEQPDGQGGWETKKRVYAKDSGNIKNKDTCKVKLYGFYRYNSKQPVNIGTISTDIVDVLEAMANDLNGSYTVEAPPEADVSGGYPSVDGYSKDNNAAVVLNDVTRELSEWSVRFLDETDGNGNYIIRAEPKGFGGAVDTLDSNTTGLRFESWNKEKTENIVNKVKVVGTDDTGSKITSTATNQYMIDRYGEKFDSIKVGYLASQSDADQIAENRLVPGKDSNGNDIEEPPESGKVSLPTLNFDDGVENDSFNIVDSDLGIDDTFTCVTQHLFYPSGRSELVFEFEQERLEERAQKDKYLGDERARIFPNQTKDAGQQSFTGDTGSAPSDTSTTGGVNDGDSDTNLLGSLDTNDVGEGLANGVGIIPKDVSGISSVTIQREVVQSATEIVGGGSVEGIYFVIDYLNQSGQSISVDYEVTNTTTNTQLASGNFNVSDGGGTQVSFVAAGPSTGDNIEAFIETVGVDGGPVTDIETASGADFFTRIDFKTASFSAHSHTDGYNTQDNQHGHSDDIDTDDFSHGGTGDATGQHGTSGTTDSKNIKVSTEDKTDR